MNLLFAVLFAPYIITSSGGGGSWGPIDNLILISTVVGGTFLTVAIMREMDRDFGSNQLKRNGVDIALWMAACICPLTWVFLFGYGLYQLAQSQDKP